MKVRVLLLGANGMLGSMIQKRILLNPNFELIATSRRPREYEENFDVMKDDITNLIKRVNPEFVINCISLNPQNNARNLFSFYQTFFINSVFCVKKSLLLIIFLEYKNWKYIFIIVSSSKS